MVLDPPDFFGSVLDFGEILHTLRRHVVEPEDSGVRNLLHHDYVVSTSPRLVVPRTGCVCKVRVLRVLMLNGTPARIQCVKLSQMIPLLLLSLLLSLLHGSEAESTLLAKLHHSNGKEHNGVQESQHEKVLMISGDGVVHSPGFPHTYPRSTVIVWRLVSASENSRIQLTFDPRFGLEDPEDGVCKYDYVEVEEPDGGMVLGRWCGSQSAPGPQTSKGNQIRIRFISDEYFPSEPGFSIHYSVLQQKPSVPAVVPAAVPSALHSVEALSEAVSEFGTVEEVLKYLEPDRWQLDLEELYKPHWQVLGKSFFHQKKTRGVVDLNLLREEVRLYSCTPRNYSVSLREELKRTDVIFWPSCLLVKRCGGNCACCSNNCYDCQCTPTKVTKKYHEVLMLKFRPGRGSLKSLTDVALEHHEECNCECKND